MTPPRTAPPSLATSVSAEASSGPEHGLQTRPSTPPRSNAPPSEPPSSLAEVALALEAMGSIHSVKCRLSTGTSMTRPKVINIQAPNSRTLSESIPSAGPRAPRTTPISAKEIAIPAPMASGARRLACTAPPRTSAGVRVHHGGAAARGGRGECPWCLLRATKHGAQGCRVGLTG